MTEDIETVDMSRETNEVTDRLDSVARGISDLTKTLTKAPESIIELEDSVPKQTHIKMRVHTFTFTVTAAATVTLRVGSVTRSFSLPGADTRTIPFPYTVDRGTDVVIGATAGVAYGFLTYVPD